MLGAITLTHAQQPGLKTQANQFNGKKIYKDAKIYDSKTGDTRESKAERIADDAQLRMEHEFQRLKSPSGIIPVGIREAELKFSSKIAAGNDSKKALSNASKSAKFGRFSFWKNRGPYNVGGRTRALAIDRTNENVILAGGVSGGLWRSENGGQTWRKVTRRFQNPSITAIVQDPRPGRSFTWYYASGERAGNSARAGGAFYTGAGVYKSQDGGRTWELLRATSDNDLTSVSAFEIVNSIAVNPANGDLYVATFEGVHRSTNGGNSFEEVLVGGRDNRTEIAITPTGQIYATVESAGNPNNGYFTSTNGDTWTEISPDFLPAAYGRTVMGIDPSNENSIYFFSQVTGAQGPAVLAKYDATASEEERWVNLSANLPTRIGGDVGNLNLQGGYNMVIKVSPADSNLVFVGGTNLYRSTTGFTTPAGQESWIAGYSPLNNISQYPGQHPDQHELVFYPSNPNKVLSGTDGGVAITEDITTSTLPNEPVDWVSLNNGYITTQPYHVSFDPAANSDDLLAGFQDNSTWYTNSTDPKADWEDIFSGDGSYSAIADGGRTRYVSAQGGFLFRLDYDEAGENISFTRVQPAGASNFAFIAPFILDPNNDNIMYMPAGRRMWRNNNLDEIPVFSNRPTSVNWVSLPNSDIPGNPDPDERDFSITALDVSKFPVANRLYYGSSNGVVFRMDNANIDGQEAIDITTGKGLPEGAFVNDINVDQSNSDRVIVTFSNYGVISLFITENGGDTWTNISGNLEENADGTGNGPSVRSTAFLGGSQGFFGSRFQRIFAATSTGLYYTNRLNGQNTVWRKENFAIANAVTDEVVTRKDGFIAVAAHGSGLFSARFPIFGNPLPESNLSVAYLLEDIRLEVENPNAGVTTPEDIEIDVTDLFVESNGNPISITFENSNPDVVTATLEGNTIKLVFPDGLEAGDQATISLVATSGEEQVAEGFTITVSEIPVYEQITDGGGSFPSQFFADFGAVAQTSDDFTIPEGDTWAIDRILAFGGANNAPELNNATIVIYADNAGVPGEEIYNSGELTPISNANDTNLNIRLPEAVELEGGNYWISVYANLAFTPNATQWFWSSQTNITNQEAHFRDTFNLFGTGAIDWTSGNDAFGRSRDQVFQIFGAVSETGSGVPEREAVALATLDKEMVALAFPNPSSANFTLNFSAIQPKGKEGIDVYNVTGQKVFAESNIPVEAAYTLNGAKLRSGFYVVQVTGKSSTRTFRIIKK